jgi:15-cis-phytoene synthase
LLRSAGEAVVTTLEESYEICRRLNRKHGTTYYWSTLVLPTIKQHHVHALYGFARYADEIVDDLASTSSVEEKALALKEFGDRFFTDVERKSSDHEVLRAVVHTVRAFDIPIEAFQRFLNSMTMDLTVETYATFDDLLVYTDGSAAVIGEMMLPILEPTDARALGHARDLGTAFQLTNFCRDIAEDLDRGRTYIPQDEIDRFGARPGFEQRRVTPGFVELLQFQLSRCDDLYRSADLGIAMLPPIEGRCIRSARILYSEIGGRIAANGYDVWNERARVPMRRKLAIVARQMGPAAAKGLLRR